MKLQILVESLIWKIKLIFLNKIGGIVRRNCGKYARKCPLKFTQDYSVTYSCSVHKLVNKKELWKDCELHIENSSEGLPFPQGHLHKAVIRKKSREPTISWNIEEYKLQWKTHFKKIEDTRIREMLVRAFYYRPRNRRRKMVQWILSLKTVQMASSLVYLDQS